MELIFRPDETTDEQDALSSLYDFLLDDEGLRDIADFELRPAAVPEGTLGIEMLHDAVTIAVHIRDSLNAAKPDLDAAGVLATAAELVSAAVNWIKSRSRGERVVLSSQRGDQLVIRTKDPATLAAAAELVAAADRPGAADATVVSPPSASSGTGAEGAV